MGTVNQSKMGYGISSQGIRLTEGYVDRIGFPRVQIIVLCVEVTIYCSYMELILTLSVPMPLVK
ncbi:MAG: hypothetical protein AEth_01874 [Candidatus Argoarchaeum ethanivorans]|uniref:Uncharacterized protein n=1 Tax=Candidatus Argoarchaeum ethanivorans TaxID=2608793 RepID=A0A8B3S050_9EURY|nr:MAG: hypothetical protein AEth_01874 [Candidatus Argoarchaeum ethanivorans]